MKFGYRTPNLKKSLKARTTGRIKRSMKKAFNPVYGKKGMGYIKNPEKAIKNSIYHKSTIDTTAFIKSAAFDKSSKKQKKNSTINTKSEELSKIKNDTEEKIKNNTAEKIKNDITLSPTTEKILNIISYIIAIIVIGYIIILIGSFIIGIIQGII